MIVEIVRIAPNLVPQLCAGQHPLGVRREHGQQVELRHRQSDLVFADLDPTRGVVDLERADGEHALTTAAGLGKCRAAKVRVDPSGEDPRVKRLRDVVVGADLETDDLIHPGRAAGEHDHRTHNALPPQLADHFGAAYIGQHPVHKYEVRLYAPAQLDCLRARACLDYVMTLKPADLGHEHSHGNVVLDHEDASTSTRWRAAQFCVGGAKPTRRDSRAERFGLRIRITRLSPPSITLASSQPSAAASCRTLTTVTPSPT